MRFFGISPDNFRWTGLRPQKAEVVFWGTFFLVAVFLLSLFIGGFLFYGTLTPEEVEAIIPAGEVTFSPERIDEVIKNLDERKIKLDEILAK